MISAVILTKKEEGRVEKCLKSIEWCDEIIIIDDDSQDKTIEKAKNVNHKVQIYTSKLKDDFSAQRNYGLEKAAGDWILFVDADEEVSEKLKKEIKKINPSENAVYYIKRRDYFWGVELKHGETDKLRNTGLIRLVKKNTGKWEGRVHEEFRIPSFVKTSEGKHNSELRIERLNGYLNHYPHPTVKEFIKSVNFYSTLRAKELFEHKKKTNVFEIIFFPFGKFIYTYFLKLGFLDGPPGFTYAFFMSFHSFLVRAKLYQCWFGSQNINAKT